MPKDACDCVHLVCEVANGHLMKLSLICSVHRHIPSNHMCDSLMISYFNVIRAVFALNVRNMCLRAQDVRKKVSVPVTPRRKRNYTRKKYI